MSTNSDPGSSSRPGGRRRDRVWLWVTKPLRPKSQGPPINSEAGKSPAPSRGHRNASFTTLNHGDSGGPTPRASHFSPGIILGSFDTTPTDNPAVGGTDALALPGFIISLAKSDSGTLPTVNLRSSGEGESILPDNTISQGISDEAITPDILTPETEAAEKPHSKSWEIALEKLTDKERQILKDFGIGNTPAFEEELKTIQGLKNYCTTNLTAGKSDKIPILNRARVHGILKKMEKYVIIGDIAIQQNPDIVALVWAGLRFCLQVALNDMQTFEGVSSALDDIAGVLGSCRIYERIHWSTDLESAKAVLEQVPQLYASCLRFMAEAINFFNTPTSTRVTGGIMNPFEIRFKPLIEDIKSGKGELERRAAVASHELQIEIDRMTKDQREQFQKLNMQLNKQFVKLNNQLGQVICGIEGLLTNESDRKRREILRWLSDVDFGAHHEKARDLRFDNTGEWLFGKPAFDTWLNAGSSTVMWLYGKAGSGKTVLSSLVIDTLTKTDPSVPVLYFYCSYGELDRKQTSPIVRTMLKQLSMRRDILDLQVTSVFDNGTPLNLKSSEISFTSTLAEFDRVYIVVDALDECSEGERKSIVNLLTRQLALQDCQIKIFLTSRPENDLIRLLKDHATYCIDANDTSKDIRPFVTASLNDHITSGALLGGKVSSELRQELIETLSGQADGMFLWATFQLDYICRQGNEVEVREQLTQLPTGLNETYDRIWKRITSEQTNTERKWALKTLQWVLRAKRPLSPDEILEASALEPLDITFESGRLASSLDYLIQVCGNFIALDSQTTRLRFIHYSVQEYLRGKQEFDSAENTVTEICITALGQERCTGGAGSMFYVYATRYWQEHSKCWEEMNHRRATLIQRFLLNKHRFGNWLSEARNLDRPLNSRYEAVAYFNLPILLKYLQEQGLHDDGFATDQSKALVVSAGSGYMMIVKLLLNAGADVNFQHSNGISALRAAVTSGSEEVVKLLLDAGANVNSEGGVFGYALQIAAHSGFRKILQMLLAAGANFNSECEILRNPDQPDGAEDFKLLQGRMGRHSSIQGLDIVRVRDNLQVLDSNHVLDNVQVLDDM